MLNKWKKLSVAPKSNNTKKSIKSLMKTLSFSDTPAVPKGSVAVCVGEEMQRIVIPTEYLGHRAFKSLLREAEEEFGYQHQGVLRIPCEVSVFERILKMVEKNKEGFCYCFSEAEFAWSGCSCPRQPMYR